MCEELPSETAALEDSCVESTDEGAVFSAEDIAFVAHAHKIAAEINSMQSGNKERFVPWGRLD